MIRFFLSLWLLAVLAGPASAISFFSKTWKEHYLTNHPNAAFVTAARKAGCYVCHVKGEDKKKVRNEYGQAVQKYLKAEDFPKEYVKDNPEEAKAKILEGFKKAGEHESKDGRKFADKIKENELPATDAGL